MTQSFPLLSPEWPFPVGHSCRLLPLQGPDSPQFWLSFVPHAPTEAETSGRPAPCRRQPSPGSPPAVPLQGCAPCRAGGAPVPPRALLQRRDGDVQVQACEGGEDAGAFCQGSADVYRRYVLWWNRWYLSSKVAAPTGSFSRNYFGKGAKDSYDKMTLCETM